VNKVDVTGLIAPAPVAAKDDGEEKPASDEPSTEARALRVVNE
jgi:hypothetical protein